MKKFKIELTGSLEFPYKIVRRKWFLFIPYWSDIIGTENNGDRYFVKYKDIEAAKKQMEIFENNI